MEGNSVIYTAIYADVDSALADLDAFEHMREEHMLGKYDAAVIDKENGEPHIVKRVDHPAIRVVPELLGGGALPRHDLQEAAQELTSSDAALVVVGEPTLDQWFEETVTHAAKIAKRTFDDTTDELAAALIGTVK
jgi:hypothetical protein